MNNNKQHRFSRRTLSLGLILCALLVPIIISVVNAAEPKPQGKRTSTDLQKVQELFDDGRLNEAEHYALKLLANPDSLSQYNKYSLHKLLAFISIANDDEENAVRQFVQALRYNPTVSPDPITWSPKVRRVFERARADYNQEQRELRQKSLATEAEKCRRASLKSLYLPGFGQISKDQNTKGFTITVLFIGSVVTYFYAQSVLPDARDKYERSLLPHEAARNWKEYRNAYLFVNISGLAVVSIYTYAFFDALFSSTASEEEHHNP